jgi:hypothetical protein
VGHEDIAGCSRFTRCRDGSRLVACGGALANAKPDRAPSRTVETCPRTETFSAVQPFAYKSLRALGAGL